MSSFKREQYSGDILKIANSFLRSGTHSAALSMASITKVELSSDYSMATLYWDTFDPSRRGDIKKSIDKIAGKMRSHLARELKVRHTPSVTFKYDSQYEDESVIDKILQEEKDQGKGF